jgi:tetratricopeptide (TPR) repeat protein
MLQEENFIEATYVLRDIFLIDPNHSGARRLEESIRQAKQAQEEWLRIQSERSHEEHHLKEFVQLQQKVEEQKQQKVEEQIQRKTVLIPQEESDEPPSKKPIIYIASAIVAAVIIFFAIYLIFPKTTSIAVLRFTNAANETGDMDLFNALPVLLAEDFGRCEHLTVIAPTSSLLYMSDSANLQKIAETLPAEYLLTGTIQEKHGRYTIQINLLKRGQKKPVSFEAIEGQLSTLSEMRLEILSKVLDEMGVRSDLPAIQQPSNTNALAYYLKGVHQMLLKSGMEMDSAKKCLQTAVQLDPSFGIAYASLADADIRSFQAMNDPQALQSAEENAQRSLRYSPNIALAHQVLGTYYRLSQKFDAALYSITHSLALFQQNPVCYRELALLAITARKFDDAAAYATSAIMYDPKNTESYFTLALAQHMKQNYSEAENSYRLAQMPGENNLMLMAFFVQSAWISEGNYEKVISYCQQMISTTPENYRYYYWIGRAYQLSLQINTAQQWLEKGLEVAAQAIEDNPDDAIAYAYAGLIHSRLGKFSDGESAMNKALQLDSNSVEILFRYADLYSVQSNKQKALAALDNALHQQLDFAEILNPDLSFIAREPEFLSIITRKVEGNWPIK